MQPDLLRGTISGAPAWYGCESQDTLMIRFRDQAIEYQPQVRQLLTWLSNQRRHRGIRSGAWHFLVDHTFHLGFRRGDPAYPPPEDEHLYRTGTGEAKVDFPYRTLSYKDIADPICDFIHSQYLLGRTAPICICKRPGCANLVAQFKKRKYCRTPECDRERQRRETDIDNRKNRDRVFISRLKRLALAMRKKKAQENVVRLREMAGFWGQPERSNPSIAKHALDLLRLIGASSSDDVPTSSPE